MINNLTIKNTEEETLRNPFLIKNMDDFLNFYVNKDGQFSGNYNSVKKRLDELKQTVGKDPIEHLYYLYYGKKLDLISVKEELENIGHIFPPATVNNLFKYTFKWKLRGRHEETPGKNEKDRIKASLEGEGGLSKLNKNRAEETRIQVARIIEKSLGNNFSIEEYNKIKIKQDKLSYIFYSFGIIQNDSREAFCKFLKELKINFGENRIVNIINDIIFEKKINIIMNINSKEIWSWLNKQKS